MRAHRARSALLCLLCSALPRPAAALPRPLWSLRCIQTRMHRVNVHSGIRAQSGQRAPPPSLHRPSPQTRTQLPAAAPQQAGPRLHVRSDHSGRRQRGRDRARCAGLCAPQRYRCGAPAAAAAQPRQGHGGAGGHAHRAGPDVPVHGRGRRHAGAPARSRAGVWGQGLGLAGATRLPVWRPWGGKAPARPAACNAERAQSLALTGTRNYKARVRMGATNRPPPPGCRLPRHNQHEPPTRHQDGAPGCRMQRQGQHPTARVTPPGLRPGAAGEGHCLEAVHQLWRQAGQQQGRRRARGRRRPHRHGHGLARAPGERGARKALPAAQLLDARLPRAGHVCGGARGPGHAVRLQGECRGRTGRVGRAARAPCRVLWPPASWVGADSRRCTRRWGGPQHPASGTPPDTRPAPPPPAALHAPRRRGGVFQPAAAAVVL